MTKTKPNGGAMNVAAHTYTSLRVANIARQAVWCPEQIPDLSFRGNELAGETGEVCNVIKKLERERLGWRGSRDTVEHLAEELADVVICADLCALSAGIDLDAAVVAKFNATSEKVDLPHRLAVLPAQGQSEPVVKALEWRPDVSGNFIATVFGLRYRLIVPFRGQRSKVKLLFGERTIGEFRNADLNETGFEYLNEPKAAAQAHFNAVILSALAAPSSPIIPSRVTEEQVEAAARKLAERNDLSEWEEFIPDARAALSAALSVPAGDGWQEIETAPKDGTIVDLYGTRNNDPRRFPAAQWLEIGEWGSGEPTGQYRWFFPAYDIYGEFVFTHFRPLPPAPEVT